MDGYWKAEQNYHYTAGNIQFQRGIDKIFRDYMKYVDDLKNKMKKEKNALRSAAIKLKKDIESKGYFDPYFKIYPFACDAMDKQKREKQAKQALVEAGSGTSSENDCDNSKDSDWNPIEE